MNPEQGSAFQIGDRAMPPGREREHTMIRKIALAAAIALVPTFAFAAPAAPASSATTVQVKQSKKAVKKSVKAKKASAVQQKTEKKEMKAQGAVQGRHVKAVRKASLTKRTTLSTRAKK